MLASFVALAGLIAAPEAFADGLVPAVPASPVAEVTTSPAAALAAALPPPPSPAPEASQSVASSATATVSSTAQGLPAAPANSATDEVSRTVERLAAEPEPPRTHSAEQRPAHAAAPRVRAQRLERRAGANHARTLGKPSNEPVVHGLDASRSSLVGPVTNSTEVTAASRSTAAPERPLPEQSPTSFPSGIASGASPALLLLLLVLLIEGFAGAPPRLSRLLSLRRLAPASLPFLLELERPD